MKRTILLVLAAGVATLPALLGVTGNSTFGKRIPATIPSGATVAPSIDDRRSPTTSPIPSETRTADDSPTAGSTNDNHGRGSGEATTSSPTRAATTARTTSTATTGDDSGRTRSGDDSGGHGDSRGKGGSGKG